jgi:hypothetical protein
MDRIWASRRRLPPHIQDDDARRREGSSAASSSTSCRKACAPFVIMGFSPTPIAPPSSRSSARLSTLRNPLRAPNQPTIVNVTKNLTGHRIDLCRCAEAPMIGIIRVWPTRPPHPSRRPRPAAAASFIRVFAHKMHNCRPRCLAKPALHGPSVYECRVRLIRRSHRLY